MVNSTNYAMVSTLAGLKRLESQIQQALMEAGGQAQTQPENQPHIEAQKLENEAAKTAVRAKSVMSSLDITA